MNDAHGPHLSPERLAAYRLGQLPLAEGDAIERHLAGCEVCGRVLEALPEDPLVARLRTASARPEPPAGADTADLPESVSPDLPPELADHPRYRILERLGAGGMGVVYKAEHRLMQRPVALKVIHWHLTDRPAARERFRQEVLAAARLAHPNIVTAHDAEQAGDIHFLVTEYVDGVSLDRLVKQLGPLPVAQACDMARQAALGMQHAFERGMVHRDIKPANLLLTPAGQVKILDFGLARFARESEADAGITPVGTIVGTPDYIAPEQALDAHRADIRADIYSLGGTLYYLLAGRPPFPEGTLLEKLMAHQERMPQPLSDFRGDLPPELAAVVERLLAKDPAQRYQTPAEVAVALERLARPAPDPAGSPTGSPPGGAPVLYTAEISRTNPTCFLFLIDQSSSMAGPFGGQPGRKKAEGVADAINRLLQNLVLKCAKSDGIRDYFHVGVIGYGSEVTSALTGSLAGRGLVPVSTIANHPLRVEQRTRKVDDGAGGLVEQSVKFPVWFEPVAGGKTPMCQALTMARQVLQVFLAHYPGCFPPLVVNITDGKSNDGDPAPVAAELRALTSTDGAVLLFNAHLSSTPAPPVLFPGREEELADAYARLLFGMSSPLPPRLQEAARADGLHLAGTARGFAFNADLVSVIRFLDIGTRVAPNMR